MPGEKEVTASTEELHRLAKSYEEKLDDFEEKVPNTQSAQTEYTAWGQFILNLAGRLYRPR